ncbi:Histidine kinase osmosensor [Cladophialophora chaetospira]|uniref:histidine kinase n=1 Tax=Cladophialophora chaetospira TaxID=386627 RepID=A0AA38X047_9EURO|nr:Histidine kinase osmosensor [Cladophialophora chaetospira]
MTASNRFQWDRNPESHQTLGSEASDNSLKIEKYPSERPRRKMRLHMHIRDQLCLLILLTNGVALMVLAVATWYQSSDHLRDAKAQTLMITANLKADQIAQQISLFRTSVQQITTRQPLQGFLRAFNNGNHSQELFDGINDNLGVTLSDGFENTMLLQAAVYPRASVPDQGYRALTYLTGTGVGGKYELPSTYANGTAIFLGDDGAGYPPQLYPNLTYGDQTSSTRAAFYEARRLGNNSTLLLGPLFLQSNTSLISLTVPINNNTSRTDILGWLTVVLDARNLYNVVGSRVGLGRTGEVVIIGPGGRPGNLFAENVSGRSRAQNADVPVQFMLPTYSGRHPTRAQNPYLPFLMKQYPALLRAWSDINGELNNAGGLMSTHNEEGISISVGYARISSNIVDWVLLFAQAHGEAVAPINQLRRTIIATIFSVVGAILIICFPIAHYAVKPIIALRTAANNSVTTYEAYDPSAKSDAASENTLEKADLIQENGHSRSAGKRSAKKKSFVRPVRVFKIPERVPERKHLIWDELTELTGKFNEMTDELSIQYRKLEDRVHMRTADLEKARTAAEAANESKTLFIANVSHELRTPLNGIIGMCAVAMQEEDMQSVRQSLKIMYKSSDLLSHLLNDLLTFSKSSIGQNFAIEEDTFRLVDIGSQLVSIFEKQASESDISLRVVFIGTNPPSPGDFDHDAQEDAIVARHDMTGAMQRQRSNVLAQGPANLGSLREIALRGDKNRILQILMNLVSNALKFTPAKGTVEVRIRYRGFIEPEAMPEVKYSHTKTPQHAGLSKAFQRISPEKHQPKTSLKGLLFDFEVEDTGPGIPEHLQQDIFKPFVQGDLALSKKHGGVGLGLAICSQLAGMMGGTFQLKSTVDIGSTFTFSIPLRYTREIVPSVTDSLARPRAGSITSSVQFETFTTRSGMARDVRSLQSKQASIYSDKESPLDVPRLVGFSQPYLIDGNTDPENVDMAMPHTPPAKPERRQSFTSPNARLATIVSMATPEDQSDRRDFQPREKEKPLEMKSSLASSSTASPLKVLVAEDNPVNQQVILKLLKLEKVTDLTLAEDGEEAVKIIEKSLAATEDEIDKPKPFSLILMDIQMPKMDGIEATKKLRELGFDAPILALTAFDHESNRAACESAGMNGFLAKPIKRTALRKVLDEHKAAAVASAEGEPATTPG